VEANTLATAATGNSAPAPKPPDANACGETPPVFDYTHRGEKGAAVFDTWWPKNSCGPCRNCEAISGFEPAGCYPRT